MALEPLDEWCAVCMDDTGNEFWPGRLKIEIGNSIILSVINFCEFKYIYAHPALSSGIIRGWLDYQTPITMLNTFISKTGSMSFSQFGTPTRAKYEIIVNNYLSGTHLSDADEPVIAGFELYGPPIDAWFSGNFSKIKAFLDDNSRASTEQNLEKSKTFGNGTTIRIQNEIREYRSGDGLEIRPTSRIECVFENLKTIKETHDQSSKIHSLITFFMGQKIGGLIEKLKMNYCRIDGYNKNHHIVDHVYIPNGKNSKFKKIKSDIIFLNNNSPLGIIEMYDACIEKLSDSDMYFIRVLNHYRLTPVGSWLARY